MERRNPTRLSGIVRRCATVGLLMSLAALTLSATADARQDGAANAAANTLPALPVTPSIESVPTIVAIQAVTLEEAYQSDFRSERPLVRGGWLVTIRGDKSILAPRALAEPLVLAGGADWTESVEWFNHGGLSGHRVCFIPAPVNAQGELARTTDGLRVWFGSARLPESVDAAVLQQERAAADNVGISAAHQSQLDAASKGSARQIVRIQDRDALIALAHSLISKWSPDESQEAAAALAPSAPPASDLK